MTKPPPAPRLVALDQFRGYTVAGMFLVRILAQQLYGIQPRDPATFAAAAAILIAVAVAACSLPARRAMRVDPLVALRYE